MYLITGGLGGIGLVLAEHFARRARARLVLVGRRDADAAQLDPLELHAAERADGIAHGPGSSTYQPDRSMPTAV